MSTIPDAWHVTNRFDHRAEYYLRSRPGYPPALLPFLTAQSGFSPQSVVADIGSGTGLLARLFLEAGCTVYGVEPNDEMRRAAEAVLAGFDRFHSLPGRAEAIPLPDHSIDLITAGQAFHWFDPLAARQEFRRILRPGGGYVALVWNVQDPASSPLVRAYQQVLHQFGEAYQEVAHTRPAVAQALADFFAPAGYRHHTFFNDQQFDFAGFRDRFLSTSTAPLPGHSQHEAALRALRQAFDAHQREGYVNFAYITSLYLGRL